MILLYPLATRFSHKMTLFDNRTPKVVSVRIVLQFETSDGNFRATSMMIESACRHPVGADEKHDRAEPKWGINVG